MVVIDSDRKDVILRITGKERDSKRIIEKEFAHTLDDLLCDDKDKALFITIEDAIPWRLYCTCLSRYFQRWKSLTFAECAHRLQKAADQESTTEGHVKHAERILREIDKNMSLDKLGVLAEVVKIVTDEPEGEFKKEGSLLSTRIQRLCQRLNEHIEMSRQRASYRSVANNVKRLIREFLQSREHGCNIIDADNLLARIDRETRVIDESSEQLHATLARLRSQLDALSQAGQTRLAGQGWDEWKARFEFLKRDPLNPVLPDDSSNAVYDGGSGVQRDVEGNKAVRLPSSESGPVPKQNRLVLRRPDL